MKSQDQSHTHAKKNNWEADFIQIQNLCPEKDNAKRMRRQAPDWEKIVAHTYVMNKYYSKYTKNSS